MDLKDLVRTIPDYPKKGIMFRDVTTLLSDAKGFDACIDRLVAPYQSQQIEVVAGIEARPAGNNRRRPQCLFDEEARGGAQEVFQL